MGDAGHYRFVSNLNCEYFPCHSGVDPECFNCLFCYCPLYVLDDRCGGRFSYTEDGIKDCSGCLLPHSPRGYDHIVRKFPEILAVMEKRRKNRKEER